MYYNIMYMYIPHIKVIVSISTRECERFADNRCLVNGPVVVTNCSPLVVVVDLETSLVHACSVYQLYRVGVEGNGCGGGRGEGGRRKDR